jgi:hypothetical protein
MCMALCVACGHEDICATQIWEEDGGGRVCGCDHLIRSNQHTCEFCTIHLIRAYRGESCAFPERCNLCKGEVR